MSASLLDVARSAVALALGRGAQQAAAAAGRARRVEIGWRDGRLETTTEATSRGLGLDLYVDGRYASVSTNDLRPEALERFVGESVALTRTLAPDPHRQLPDPSLYGGQAQLDLDLHDPVAGRLDAAERRRMAEAMEAAARAVSGAEAIASVSTSFGDSVSEQALVQSNGFEGVRRTTDFGMSAEVGVRDPDGRRPEDWEGASARHLSDLPPPEEVGRGAALRALSRVGARKGKSAVMAVAVEGRAAGRLVGMLFGALGGAALQQKRSFLEGKLGQATGSPRLDVRDDPHLPRGLGSRLFDGEGIAARPFAIFEGGLLRSYYVDSYYGRKLEMAPTTGRVSNLEWKLGTEGREALLAGLGEGLFLTGFLGGNSNGTTGDLSLGVQGFEVRGGRLGGPVAEMNLSGNHLELWGRLAAVGNDPYRWSPMRTPTLVFDGVQIAGL